MKQAEAQSAGTAEQTAEIQEKPEPQQQAVLTQITGQPTSVTVKPQNIDSPTGAREQYELGDKFYYAKNYEQAVYWYRKSAEQGNASAQKDLGYMYRLGKGVEQDYAEAVRLYRLAAEQGNALAQSNLGDMYEYGKGVARDLQEARKWYGKAAAQGHTNAQGALKRLDGR